MIILVIADGMGWISTPTVVADGGRFDRFHSASSVWFADLCELPKGAVIDERGNPNGSSNELSVASSNTR